MLNRKFATLLLITALSISIFSTIALSRVHAAGSISLSPATQALAASGAPVSFTVMASGVDNFNGWDIMVVADPNALAAQSISIAGSLFGGSASESVNCVNDGQGIPIGQPGDLGCTTDDGLGIVHSVVTSSAFSGAGASGLLFTINYIANNPPGAFVNIIRADILNGSPTPVSVTTSNAIYGTPNPDVGISTNPVSIPQGTSGVNSPITLTSLAGFSDTVNVAITSVPLGVSAALTPVDGNVFISPGGAAVETLTVAAALNAPLGTASVGLTATSPSLVSGPKTFTVAVTVTPAPTISISCGSPITIPAGSNGVAVITGTSLNTFFGTVTLSATAPAGLTPQFLSNKLIIAVQTSAISVMTVAVGASTAPGPYAVMVTGSTGTLSPTCMQSINVIAAGSPDFSLSASPTSLTIIRGAFDLSTLSLTGLNGFSESVSVSTAVTNTLVGAPTASATPFSGGMSTYTVSIARSGQTGLFNVTAIGTTASGLSHSTTITTKIVDFGMVCSTCIGIVQGDTAVDPAGTVDVSDFRLRTGSIFGFAGHVTFTCSVNPSIAGGPSCTPPFASKDYTVGAAFAGFAALTIPSTSPAGSYILTITGTYVTPRGLVIHHDMVVITSSLRILSCCLFDVQTYTITGSPSPLVIRHHGSTGSATSTITVAGQDGFSGLVNVTATVPAVQGLTASLSASQVNIPLNPDGSSGSGTATLTVNTDNHTPSGQYAVTITGQSLVVDAQGNNVVLTITGTVLVNVPSNKVQLNVVSFSPSVSVSAGGVQTWTYSVTNTLSTAQFVQITVSGVSTSGTRPFQFVSAIVSVAAGATATVTVTGTFGSMDQGLTFNFSQVMFFGSSATALNQAFFTPAKNQFTVVA